MARYGHIDRRRGIQRDYIAESTTPVQRWVDDAYEDGNFVSYTDEKYPIAQISVEKPETIALSDPRIVEHGEDAMRQGTEMMAKLRGRVPYTEITRLTQQQMTTPQMFVDRPGKITSAYSDPIMRYSTGKLFGVIADDFRGQRMIADQSLSEYSSPLVRRALDAGLLEPNPDNPEGEITNEEDFVEDFSVRYPHDFEVSGGSERSQREVNRASGDLIKRLRGRNLSPQQFTKPTYEQPQLPLEGGW